MTHGRGETRTGIAAVLSFLLLICCARPARAWNDTGHMTCAYIAYRELKPEVRRRVSELLRQHPRYRQDLLRDMPEGFADPDLYAFIKAATWPDMVRDLRNPMHATHNHPTWHYVDFPLVAPADAATLHPPMPDAEGGDVDNVLKALAKVSGELSNPQTAAADRAIDLCWLSHLIGDLHQPLHATSFFSQKYPDGDKGGNLFLVRAAGGEIVNLHYVWDGILGPQSNPRAVRLITENILANSTCRRGALAAQLSHDTFKAWALESYADARDVVYDNFRLRGAAPDLVRPHDGAGTGGAGPSQLLHAKAATQPSASPGRRPWAADAPALPISYEAVARELASQRIALAGYRLADELNRVFGNAP